MIEGKWLAPGDSPDEVLALRIDTLGIGRDEYDAQSRHVIIFKDDIPCATGRIRYYEGEFLLEHICVKESHRMKGMGDLAVRLLLYKAQQHFAKVVRVICDDTLYPFFGRYGFKPNDAGGMIIMGEDIQLDNCHMCGQCKDKTCSNPC